PAGGTADHAAGAVLRVEVRLRLAGLRRDRVHLLPGRRLRHRPAHPAIARPAHLAPDVAGPGGQHRFALHAGQAGTRGRHHRLPEPVVGVVGVQAAHRQGGHGPWRLQAAGGPGRLVRLERHPAHDPAVVARRRHRRLDLAVRQGPRPRHADPVRSLPGHRRLDHLLLGRGPDRRLPALRRSGVSGYIIGLTGGVASGKSAVAERFAALRVHVADADVASRNAVAIGSPGLAAVVEAFGPGVLDAAGGLDRAAMRRRIFDDQAARLTLEGIIHPQVRTALRAECEAAPGPYAIAAIPLLAEGGGRAAYPWLDRILVIDVPVEVQIERLLQRDGIDRALAERMVAAQASREERLAIADDVLPNTGGLSALPAQVAELDALYRTLATRS